ncbi:hypothetical protein LSCM1_06227 [Leishmania martiniquensis]|uniref:PDZ domain-containing protein n=1 Tax=Leishmania martiniquensis TaxID=1580590 RepID=A0A836GUR0_9TRYP|nr:hypothetical protein LSCM1_06227 [Leishmania martiniquensis]
MSLSSSYQDAQGASQSGYSGSRRSLSRPTPARSTVFYVGRDRASQKCTPVAASLQPAMHSEASPSASLSKLIASTALDSRASPPQGCVTKDHDAEVTVGVLTSAALAQTSVQPADQFTAYLSTPSSQPRGNSLDGCSTAASTRPSYRVAQRRARAASLTFTSGGRAPWFVSRRCASEQSLQSRATGLSSAYAIGRSGSFPSQHAAAPAPPSSAGLSHIRPLLSSKEADYLNLAYQRSFVGRFRCATPVVVRTPAAATLHASLAPPTADDGAPSQWLSTRKEQEETTATAAHAAATDAVDEGVNTTLSASPDQHTHGVEADAPHAVDASTPRAVASGHPCSLGAAERPQLPLERRSSGTGVPITSKGAARRGAGGGRPSSVLGGARVRDLLPFSSVSDVVRSARAMKSAGLTGRPLAAYAGAPAANMEALVKSGLHTSLWLALQDGGLEVRSMANPNELLTSLPRSGQRVIITSLTEICGNRVVAGYTDGTLHVYDAVTMEDTGEYHAHTAAVTSLLYVHGAPRLSPPAGATAQPRDKRESTPTQSLLLTGSLDRSIVVWEAASMSYLHKLKGSLRSISALAATATGGYAFSGSDDGTLRMWDAVQGDQFTITKEERAKIVKSNGATALKSVASLPQPLMLASSGLPFAAGLSSTSAPIDAMRGREVEAGGETRASTPRALSRRSFQRPLLKSAPVSPNASLVAGSSAFSISSAMTDGLFHRPGKLRGAAKSSPSSSFTGACRAPFMERGTRLPAKSADCGGREPSFRLPSLPSSPLLAAVDIAAFAPTKTGTSSSLLREGSVLLGPNGSISSLRCDFVQGAEGEDEGQAGVAADSAAATALHHGVGDRRSSATRRNLRRDLRKRLKSLSGTRSPALAPATSGAAAATKRRSASAAPATGESAKQKKTASKKAMKAAKLASEATTARTWESAKSLEQRLELWLHLYQQRVLFSAASLQLTQLNSAGYDAVSTVNWPIECAHKDCVTALTVVEDRLLVSASRDATAKVFALPSGQYVRALHSSRRMPLSSVLYDASVGRLYTAFSDGSLATYDTRIAGLPLLSQIHSPHTLFSSTFVQLRMAPMRRFMWTAAVRGEEAQETPSNSSRGGGVSLTVVGTAHFDRTTMAHGPNQTATSYRVGQPSLRELNAAVSLQPLQQQRIRNLTEQATRTTRVMLEGIELTDMRRCGLVLERGYVRWHTYCVFARWRQWARRRALRPQFEGVVAVRAERCAESLLGRYRHQWLNWTRARKQASASALLREVQLQPRKVLPLSVESEVSAGQRRVWQSMASTMGKRQQSILLSGAYRRWREFLRAQQAHLRQCVAFNKLLLSMNASSYRPSSCILARITRKAMRGANQAKALWLLREETQFGQAYAFRRRCFDLWRTCARQRRCRAAAAADSLEWSAVEPLSATLIQPERLRRRYFALWQDFALCVSRSRRLASELDTLRVEWATLQRTLESPMTVVQLREKLSAAESSTAEAEAEATRLAARLETVAMEAAALRTDAALNMLIGGYRVPSVPHAATPLLSSTASATTELSSMGSVRRGSLASASAMPLNGCCCGDAAAWGLSPSVAGADWREEERAQRQEEEMLLCEVGALLRALKGNAMRYDRDDKLLSAAHALALRLPILEPAHNAQASLEGSQGRHSHLSPQKQRTPRRLSTWSISSAKRSGSTALPAPMLPSQQRHRQNSFAADPAGSASPSTANVALPTASAVARNTISAAQMWAAQPAEETYACLADAFTAVCANLSALLHVAALEWGTANATSRSALARAGKDATEGATEVSPTAFTPTSWLTQVPLKQRRAMIGEVLKLVTLFDSFTAHNDLPVKSGGSTSTRGGASARAMPLCSLCSRDTATALLERSTVLLELVDPHLWPRQMKLNHLQDVHAASIAELNATVSTASGSDPVPQNTFMTLSSAGGGEPNASSAPSLGLMRPPALYLSDDVLQEAGSTMMQQDAATSGMTHSFGQLFMEHRTNRSASSVHSGPTQATPLVSVAEGYTPVRLHCTDDPLNSTLRSWEEEGATPTSEPPHLRRYSFSHRSYSGVSTPRSYTPRTSTPSAAGTGPNGQLVKPYLGFRVNVIRDAQTLRRTTISIREVTPQYINAEGEDVDGPAQAAGLQIGDQLVRFAGYAVTDLAAFNAVVSRHVHTGAALPVVVLRNGEQLCKTIVVGSRSATGF